MFVVLLKFSGNKDQAGQFMEDHNAWLQRGFDDGVFLLAGSLQPGLGGAIMASETTLEELEQRVREDPFVVAQIVTAEVLQISPARADPRLGFLLA